ncbi:MAG: branched-chain amino acid aminotransferase [Oscillospiraceae bacterium]|nr:branched-chain amino acid aminotransferase [Oscillospiraceae bacterium]
MLDIKVTKIAAPKPKPEGPLGFGKTFTDHMFLMDYTEERGWHDPRIQPYGDLTLSPSARVLHYSQEMFEGMKAYKGEDGKTYLFRPEMNAKRANITCERICFPQLPVEDFIQAVSALVKLDADWIPTQPGTSLYIRPFIISTEASLGLDPSKKCLFMVILSPSGLYYKDGLEPVSIWVEDDYVRAVRGGVGFAKTGGNYAAALAAQAKANKAGYDQVLWLDGVERKYIEEVGSMNIFFKIDGKVVTPALNGSILPGVTRDSVLTLCRDWGLPVEEQRITIEELAEAHRAGKLEEAFGTGTAAVIIPVGKLCYKDEVFTISDGKTGPLSKRLYDTVTGIQCGKLEDKFGWRVTV